MRQTTINESIRIEGKGLHTGLYIHLALHPAKENTGIRICRTDLAGKPGCRVFVGYVSGTSRGTVLEHGDWKVSTVEHLLSALYATGVTNCLIETDAPEVPILDGSALPYVTQINKVGIREQDAEADEWIVKDTIEFEHNGSRMMIEPANRFETFVKIDFPSPILHIQYAELNDLNLYGREIAPARTFCFLREIKTLLHLGLIKGGDLQNAIVIYDKKMWQWSLNRLADKLGQPRIDNLQLGYLNETKYHNEPARHKLLDLIGDMSLLGKRIRGRITAEKPGHGFNTWCGKQLIERGLIN